MDFMKQHDTNCMDATIPRRPGPSTLVSDKKVGQQSIEIDPVYCTSCNPKISKDSGDA